MPAGVAVEAPPVAGALPAACKERPVESDQSEAVEAAMLAGEAAVALTTVLFAKVAGLGVEERMEELMVVGIP